MDEVDNGAADALVNPTKSSSTQLYFCDVCDIGAAAYLCILKNGDAHELFYIVLIFAYVYALTFLWLNCATACLFGVTVDDGARNCCLTFYF